MEYSDAAYPFLATVIARAPHPRLDLTSILGGHARDNHIMHSRHQMSGTRGEVADSGLRDVCCRLKMNGTGQVHEHHVRDLRKRGIGF